MKIKLLILVFTYVIALPGCNSNDGSPSSTGKPVLRFGDGTGTVNWKEVTAKTPEKRASLTLWLAADKGVKLSQRGSDAFVSAWKDQSTNGITFEPGNGAGPPPRMGKVVAQKQNPAIHFPGLNTGLVSAEIPGSKLIKPDGASLIVVQLQEKGSPSNDTFGWGDCGASRFNTQYSANGSIQFQMGALASGTLSPGIPADWENRLHIISVVRDGKSARLSVDGVELVANVESMPTNLNTGISAAMTIGNNCGRGFKGQISEILLYKEALGTREEQGLVKYLAQKYGVTLR